MSEQSRRAQKKARTHAHVRDNAQRLFHERGFDAVTIADVASAADVAVQTVFNHFATKEELFWSGRSPWVPGPAEAVRGRAPGVPPLTALREHLTDAMGRFVERLGTPEGRCTVGALDRSTTLQAAERELHHEAERLLRVALEEAWTGPDAERPAPADPRLTAALVAATWLATTRTLVTALRDRLPAPEDVPALAARTRALTDRLLARLQDDAGADLGVRPGVLRDDEDPGVLRAV
ncbi:TetR/AcrR family transcriptional regulator [Geodermatophilus sp. SYSU D00696]